MNEQPLLKSIDDYISQADEPVSGILQEIRQRVHQQVPQAEECISYKMPAFRDKRIFIYFAAFKKHIGIYPPIANDHPLVEELSQFRNAKGNLAFPLNQPIPYATICKVIDVLHEQYSAKAQD